MRPAVADGCARERGETAHTYAHVKLTAAPAPPQFTGEGVPLRPFRKVVHVTIALDVSGSMQQPSPCFSRSLMRNRQERTLKTARSRRAAGDS